MDSILDHPTGECPAPWPACRSGAASYLGERLLRGRVRACRMGYVNKTGQPYSASCVRSMLGRVPSVNARSRAVIVQRFDFVFTAETAVEFPAAPEPVAPLSVLQGKQP